MNEREQEVKKLMQQRMNNERTVRVNAARLSLVATVLDMVCETLVGRRENPFTCPLADVVDNLANCLRELALVGRDDEFVENLAAALTQTAKGGAA